MLSNEPQPCESTKLSSTPCIQSWGLKTARFLEMLFVCRGATRGYGCYLPGFYITHTHTKVHVAALQLVSLCRSFIRQAQNCGSLSLGSFHSLTGHQYFIPRRHLTQRLRSLTVPTSEGWSVNVNGNLFHRRHTGCSWKQALLLMSYSLQQKAD